MVYACCGDEAALGEGDVALEVDVVSGVLL
jgi:hypothetical protein